MRTRLESAMVSLELVGAIALLGAALIPLAFSFRVEQKACRGYYYRAVALELVDGEMEILKAGEWRNYAQGDQDYPIKSSALAKFPPGRFQLNVSSNKIRLEWLPAKPGMGGRVIREAALDRK